MILLYGPDGRPVVGMEGGDRMVEVCRSWGYKLQAEAYGGAKYESRDFFASQKTTCKQSEEEDAGMALFAYCKSQVLRDVREYVLEIQERAARRQQRSAA